jgi:hypothetical protein
MPGHRAARRRGQCPKPRTFAAVGAQHRGIDGAEHSAMLVLVMAGNLPPHSVQNSLQTGCTSPADPRHDPALSRAQGHLQQAPRRERPQRETEGEAETTPGSSRLGVCRWSTELALQGRQKTPPHEKGLRTGASPCGLRACCNGFSCPRVSENRPRDVNAEVKEPS